MANNPVSASSSAGTFRLSGGVFTDHTITIPDSDEAIKAVQDRLLKEGVTSEALKAVQAQMQKEGGCLPLAADPETRSLFTRLKELFANFFFGPKADEALLLACIAFHCDTPTDTAMLAFGKLKAIAPDAENLRGGVEVKGDTAKLALGLIAPNAPAGAPVVELEKHIPFDPPGRALKKQLEKNYEQVLDTVPTPVPALDEAELARMSPPAKVHAIAQHAKAQVAYDAAVTQRFMNQWMESVNVTRDAGLYEIELESGKGASRLYSPKAAAVVQKTMPSLSGAPPQAICFHLEDLLNVDAAARKAGEFNLTHAQANYAILLLTLDMSTPMMADDLTYARHPTATETPAQRVVTQDGKNVVVEIKSSSILPASIAATEHCPRRVEYTQTWRIGPEKGDVHCTTKVTSLLGDGTSAMQHAVV